MGFFPNTGNQGVGGNLAVTGNISSTGTISSGGLPVLSAGQGAGGPTLITGNGTEQVMATFNVPALTVAPSLWYFIVEANFTINTTTDAYTVRSRIGGLGGPSMGAITTNGWTATGTGGLSLDCLLSMQAPGNPATWAGCARHSALQGSQTNTATNVATNSASVSSLSPTTFVFTINLVAGDTANVQGAAGWRIV